MRTRILVAALAACLSSTVLAEPVPAGRVAEWSGGTADIMTYGHDGPIGRIHEDGSVTFDLPAPEATGQTIADTFDRCRTGGLTIENGEAEVAATMLYVEHGGAELGLVAATSPEIAAWSLSWGQTPLVKGAYLRWFHVDGEAHVTGDCVEEMVTVSGPLEFRTENRLHFADGWNLVRTAYLEIVEHEDGSRHETHTVQDALQTFPDDALWYLSAE